MQGRLDAAFTCGGRDVGPETSKGSKMSGAFNRAGFGSDTPKEDSEPALPPKPEIP